MNLGWSTSGQDGLRATNADREAVLRVLDAAQDEERLDSVEHAQRSDAVRAAKTRGDLAALTADLPASRNESDWTDQARVRRDDRERAAHWLAEAVEQGRLTSTEHDHRVTALSMVDTYARLKNVLQGVPGWPDAPIEELLASDADRRAALQALEEAVADGRIHQSEHPAMEADIRQARRVADLDALVATLAHRATDLERENTAWALEAAYRDGQLDVGERVTRMDQTMAAVSNADLSGLVADLHGDSRRLTQSDRDRAAARLKHALDEGRLDLAEYDTRLRAAHTAATAAQLAALFIDLTDPPRPAGRGLLDVIFDTFAFNSALLPEPSGWWERLYPKLAWKLFVALLLLVYAGLGVRYPLVVLPIGIVPVVVLCYLPLMLLEFSAVSSAVWKQSRRHLEAVQSALAGHPDLSEARIGAQSKDGRYTGTVDVFLYLRPGLNSVPAAVVDEAVRLLWQSRLYPLRTINFKVLADRFSTKGVTRLDRATRAKVRHRFGPRPYGPLPPPPPGMHR